jgi:hypothetical protein
MGSLDMFWHLWNDIAVVSTWNLEVWEERESKLGIFDEQSDHQIENQCEEAASSSPEAP